MSGVCAWALANASAINTAGIVASEAVAGVSIASSAATFGGRVAGPAIYDVYLGYSGGKAVYVGITNDILRRQGEWAGEYALRSLANGTLTRDQARAIEQVLIETNPDFRNRINSISPTRDWYDEAKAWAQEWLNRDGICR